ncbi:urokinase plasminogen activator surface receptor [Oreochromis niloticus]|uniref:urokinase plasminogen activator surface receptor n=1 Tax=Oreochromis niloticus TaxID=8128 RepID=UPI0009053969|nr:urokinase plasminogen activator surface receptor [Oreochromis niloticus]
MQILVLILGIVLLPKACALICFGCIPGLSGRCTQTTNYCPFSTLCGSIRVTSYAYGSKVADIKMKTCAVAEQCVGGSINFGVAQTRITSNCCTSELCNFQDAPEGSISSPNGKKCFQCDGIDCTKTLKCNGNEDHCISTAVTVEGKKVTVKGCASKLICSKTQSAQISAIIGEEINCCQGDLCNSARMTTTSQPSRTTADTTTTTSQPSSTTAGTTAVGLLLFVTPLISLVLFS